MGILLKIIIFIFLNISIFPIYPKDKLPTFGCTNENNDLWDSDYLLGPGDKIYINFFGYKELSGEFLILNNGKISLPLVGDASVSGLDTKRATELLENLYKKELLSSKLDLKVEKSRPINISIIGEVKNPGSYKFTRRESKKDQITIIQEISANPKLVDAIEYAGGLTKDSNLGNICLKRKFLINSKNIYQTKKINLISLLQNGEQENNPYLQDEDVVYIGKLEKNNSRFQNNNFLTSRFIYVNVLGEVNNPGLVEVKNNISVLDAISAAGGIKSFTSSGYGKLIRVEDDGSNFRETFKIDYENNKNLKAIKLKDGDTIFISKNAFSKGATAIGNISNPIINILRIFALEDFLND